MPRTTARKAPAPPPRCAMRHEGAKVAIVSGGDPGVFAMAAAVCAEIEAGPDAWRALDLAIVPGITAMLAVAARAGAPLGHDFCALSLSDNLKPWELIERRLDAAAAAGFVIALYNPISRARPWQLGAALERLRRHLPAATPVVFGRAVGRADERVAVTTLGDADPANADMATLIIVGSRETRMVARPGGALVYTPRTAADAERMIEPHQRFLDARRRRHLRPRRPRQHDDRQAEAARRRDLAIGRRTAAVLGDDDVDVMPCEKRAFVGSVERAAAGEIGGARHRQRRLDRIDAADEIEVLRRSPRTAPARCGRAREKRGAASFRAPARRLACRRPRSSGRRRPRPRPDDRAPAAGPARGSRRRLHWRRCGPHRDASRRSGASIASAPSQARETRSAAETADPHRDRLRRRRSGAAGERQRHREIGARRQALRELPRFAWCRRE